MLRLRPRPCGLDLWDDTRRLWPLHRSLRILQQSIHTWISCNEHWENVFPRCRENHAGQWRDRHPSARPRRCSSALLHWKQSRQHHLVPMWKPVLCGWTSHHQTPSPYTRYSCWCENFFWYLISNNLYDICHCQSVRLLVNQFRPI